MGALLIWLTLADPGTAFSCWSCPPGKTCELVDGPRLTKAELQEYADNTCGGLSQPSEQTLSVSTGLSVKITCSPHGSSAEQLAPNKVLHIQDDEPGHDVTENTSPINKHILRADCVSQQDCLNAHAENLKYMNDAKMEDVAKLTQ